MGSKNVIPNVPSLIYEHREMQQVLLFALNLNRVFNEELLIKQLKGQMVPDPRKIWRWLGSTLNLSHIMLDCQTNSDSIVVKKKPA